MTMPLGKETSKFKLVLFQGCDFHGHSKHAIHWELRAAPLLYGLMRYLAQTVGRAHGFSRFIAMVGGVVRDGIDSIVVAHPARSNGLQTR